MKQARTITDLDSIYNKEINKFLEEVRLSNITEMRFLNLVKSLDREYLKGRDRINGKEV